MTENNYKGLHDLDIYLYEKDGYSIRRKTWYFYSLPIWVRQYKIKNTYYQ